MGILKEIGQGFTALNYEKLAPTVSTGITSSKLRNSVGIAAVAAFITTETASINYTLDGTTPTNDAADAGHEMKADEQIIISGIEDLTKFRCIEKSAGNGAKVKVSVYFGTA